MAKTNNSRAECDEIAAELVVVEFEAAALPMAAGGTVDELELGLGTLGTTRPAMPTCAYEKGALITQMERKKWISPLR